LVLVLGGGCARQSVIAIRIEGNQQYVLQEKLVDWDGLAEACVKRFNRFGPCPVIIEAPAGTRHEEFRTALDACLRAGHWRYSAALPSQSPVTFPLLVSGQDEWEWQGLIGLETEEWSVDTNRVVDILLIGDTIRVDGQERDLDAILHDLALPLGARTNVVFRCTRDAKHGDVVSMLRVCQSNKLRHVVLSM
jgi:biopolymer transport protein ExbD